MLGREDMDTKRPTILKSSVSCQDEVLEEEAKGMEEEAVVDMQLEVRTRVEQ